MITITESATEKVTDLLAEENDPTTKLRVFVQGGGCSGFKYGFAFEQVFNDDDFHFEQGAAKFVVDAMSMQYLDGATIDYKEELMGASFTINNPQAQSTCGCGSSFSV